MPPLIYESSEIDINLIVIQKENLPLSLFIQGLATQCKAKTNFHFSWQGFCQVKVLNMTKFHDKKSESWFQISDGFQKMEEWLPSAFLNREEKRQGRKLQFQASVFSRHVIPPNGSFKKIGSSRPYRPLNPSGDFALTALCCKIHLSQKLLSKQMLTFLWMSTRVSQNNFFF